MPHNKLRIFEVGVLIRIFYNNKWCHGQIEEMNNDKVTIKLWKSPIKYKLYEIERSNDCNDWLKLIKKKKYTEMNV